MKQISISLLWLVTTTAGLFSACSAEEEVIGNVEEEIKTISFSETIKSDGGTVDKKDVYYFADNLLMKHITTQEFYGQSFSNEINFSYSDGKAVRTDANNYKAIYTLNNKGYATECIYQQFEQVREYKFYYSNDYLTRIDEKINGIPYSSIELQYNLGDLQTVHSNEQTFLFEVSKDTNNYKLSCLFFEDLHPLSVHIDAIYARLLGKQSLHLISRCAHEGNDKEWTTYTYLLNSDHKPMQIEVATTATGTVYDNYGKASEETRTDRRTINANIK